MCFLSCTDNYYNHIITDYPGDLGNLESENHTEADSVSPDVLLLLKCDRINPLKK